MSMIVISSSTNLLRADLNSNFKKLGFLMFHFVLLALTS